MGHRQTRCNASGLLLRGLATASHKAAANGHKRALIKHNAAPQAPNCGHFGSSYAAISQVSAKRFDCQLVVAEARRGLGPTLPPWFGEFVTADRKSRGKLAATLRAYAEADMNVLKTAKALSVHPNTIYARTQRISDTTGKNPLGYNDLTELLLALDCWPE